MLCPLTRRGVKPLVFFWRKPTPVRNFARTFVGRGQVGKVVYPSVPGGRLDRDTLKSHVRQLAAAGVYIGTSSWKYPGWLLNCQPHDIPALIHARLIKPLGNPSANGTKYFATGDLLETAKDRSWLVKMTTAINQHWQRQNARKKCHSTNGSENGHSDARDLAEMDGER